MSEILEQEAEQPIDGLTRSQWTTVLKTLTADQGWLLAAGIISRDVQAANETLFNSPEPERQNALHEAIGFLKFANRLAEIRDRARYVSERGVSPDAAFRDTPV
jgi:hypothetical protein